MQKVIHSFYGKVWIVFRYPDSSSISLSLWTLFNVPSRYFPLSLLSTFIILILFIEASHNINIIGYSGISFFITNSISFNHILRYLNFMTILLTFSGMDIFYKF